MYVKQISVFIENTPGRHSEFTKVLADAAIDLVSAVHRGYDELGILAGSSPTPNSEEGACRTAGTPSR
jgi:hypothetical protein